MQSAERVDVIALVTSSMIATVEAALTNVSNRAKEAGLLRNKIKFNVQYCPEKYNKNEILTKQKEIQHTKWSCLRATVRLHHYCAIL
jgi:hypothetical protein